MTSSFGDDRDHGARHHEGIDIQAPKLTPVVAVADGTVARITQEIGTENCCSLVIRHDDGWQSVYVHLNNDLYGTDDGMGVGVRPDLEVGAKVTAGEVIGWVGDSGNAEDSVDHLHFELRTSDGVAVDPAPSLRKARLEAEFPETPPEWPYLDDETSAVQWVAARLLTEGLFLPCDESGLDFCPDEVADPEFVRDIARHLSGVEPPLLEGRLQDMPQVFEPLGNEQRVIDELMGCPTPEPCLELGVAESDLAMIAAWAVDRIQSAVITNPEVVIEMGQLDTLPSAGEAEAQLRDSGLIGACRPPLDGGQLLTRERALTSLVLWVVGPAIDCVEMSQLRR
ncbi:MAG: M23 family metallopeptidase [Acidimicrobiia bacterium]